MAPGTSQYQNRDVTHRSHLIRSRFTTMSESDEITLWCWVMGDAPHNAFSVFIKRSATIHLLKSAIHAQTRSFKDIGDIPSLNVYKVGE